MDTNVAVLVGRLTKDPVLRSTSNGKKVVAFTLAANRDKETADFVSVVAWEKTAEALNKYCNKGSKILVNGRIQTRNYDDQKGKRVYITEVVAHNIQFLDMKKDEQQNEQPIQQQYGNSDRLDISSDDLPF